MDVSRKWHASDNIFGRRPSSDIFGRRPSSDIFGRRPSSDIFGCRLFDRDRGPPDTDCRIFERWLFDRDRCPPATDCPPASPPRRDHVEAIVEPVTAKIQATLAGLSGYSTGKYKLTVTNWEKGDHLGSGCFGSVYEGITDGGCLFAVKEVSLLDQGRVSRLEQEIALLSQFQHENIVQYYGTQKDESKLYIFLELADQGDIRKLYQTNPLTDRQVSVYTSQILQGLKYLHNQNMIHRDIKCANLLVHANGSVKVADFGLAKIIERNDIKSLQGTAYWMAPEVVSHKGQGYGLPADIWSLGCTVLEMLTRNHPYPDLEWMQALFKIGKGKPPLVPDSLSRGAQDFIHLCLQVKPDDRPTAAQLLEHQFVKNPLPPTSSGSVSPYNHHRQS